MSIKITYKKFKFLRYSIARPVLAALYVFIALFISTNISYAMGQQVVVYPVYHNDADRVITEMLDGMHDQLGDITEIPVDTTLENNDIRKRFTSLTDQDVVIALTSEMGTLLRSSGFNGQLIEGVSESNANAPRVTRIGVHPSPEIYLRSLKKIHSGVKRLFYFHSDTQSGAELSSISSTVDNLGIEVKLISVDSISDAMNKLNDVIKKSDNNTDAIWIPYELLSLASNTMLKFVLSESWKKSLIVYTDSLDAVVRGLLFTLAPDYHAYGKYLGKYVKNMITSHELQKSEVIPYFDDVYLMINQRFSVHIGLNINRSMLGKYKVVVPAK